MTEATTHGTSDPSGLSEITYTRAATKMYDLIISIFVMFWYFTKQISITVNVNINLSKQIQGP